MAGASLVVRLNGRPGLYNHDQCVVRRLSGNSWLSTCFEIFRLESRLHISLDSSGFSDITRVRQSPSQYYILIPALLNSKKLPLNLSFLSFPHSFPPSGWACSANGSIQLPFTQQCNPSLEDNLDGPSALTISGLAPLRLQNLPQSPLIQPSTPKPFGRNHIT
jgi:hypothetical protein